MNELIEALQIFAKYTSDEFPTACKHEIMYVLVEPDSVSQEDIAKLEALGFSADISIGSFFSYKYGRAWPMPRPLQHA